LTKRFFAGVQDYRDTRLQGYRDTRIQGCRVAGAAIEITVSTEAKS